MLNAVQPRGTREAESRQALEAMGAAVAPISIVERIAYQDAVALGRGVSEYGVSLELELAKNPTDFQRTYLVIQPDVYSTLIT